MPNTSGLSQHQTSHHLFAPAVSGNLALNEGPSIYNSNAKTWWVHGPFLGSQGLHSPPKVLWADCSTAMPFFYVSYWLVLTAAWIQSGFLSHELQAMRSHRSQPAALTLSAENAQETTWIFIPILKDSSGHTVIPLRIPTCETTDQNQPFLTQKKRRKPKCPSIA